ncbi:valine--tRNA ligase [Candidatus Woesearchaeota archaeon]|nr:valine--tRNA ligase [Candidatus Woesearchaeota archaeon]
MEKKYDPKQSEEKWQKQWEEEGIYKFDPDSDAEIYSIDTPPPTISGKIHMGHAFSYTQADFIVRYQRMQGKNIFYPFGFDDNGLATEKLVEKEKGVKARRVGREAFQKLCLEVSEKYENDFRIFWGALGLSVDWDQLYSTINPWCIKTSQRSFIDLYKKGREYRKEAPTMWCPDCQTAIAQVELEDKEFDSQFNDIIFKIIDESGKETDLIIATTRPELLPACVAIFAHPDDERYKKIFNKKAKVPLFDQEVTILPDVRADPEKGTGAVMCCTFGDQTDMEWYMAHNLPLRIVVNENGTLNDLSGKYTGMKLKEARKEIISDLDEAGLLVATKPIKHHVNVHERCGTEVEILHTKQWFIKYLDIKDELIARGNELTWYPKHMKVRYDNWIEGLQWDWCISRQRYFGVPFPVWYCKECDAEILATEEQLPVDPLKDEPKEPCHKCGCTEFIPEQDILDTWATSSLTPQINSKWMENEDLFKRLFPMNLRPQAHDIITFWLFNTVVKAHLHNQSIPWKDVMISGHGLDPHGKKMSKSKGNVVDPRKIMEKYNSDCLRFWAAGSKLGEDMPYQEKDVVTGQKTITKLWNASRFVHMHIENYKPGDHKLEEIDKWIISKLNRMIKETTEAFEKYEYSKARFHAEMFFWHDLCDNYLEIVKDRLYNEDVYGKEAKESGQFTLHYCLTNTLKLFAPIMPYISEEIYRSMFSDKSIHTSKWPEYIEKYSYPDQEKMGEEMVKIIGMVRKDKSQKNMSLKTELAKLTITSPIDLTVLERDIKMTTKAQTIEFKQADALKVDMEY